MIIIEMINVCFMQDLIEHPEEEGCYIIDWRKQAVEDSVNQLTEDMTPKDPGRRQQCNCWNL